MPHNSDPSGQFNREEHFFGFHPLHLIDRLFESAERHSILCCHEFCDRLLRMRQHKLASASSSPALALKKEVLEELYQQIEQSLKMNFDKFELYTLSYILQLTAADERLLWRQERQQHATQPKGVWQAAPLPVELRALQESEKDDLQLLQDADEAALDAELAALRSRITVARKEVRTLRAVQPKVAAFVQLTESLSAEKMERWHLSDTQQALEGLQLVVARLLDLEEQTKKALRGSQFDHELPSTSLSAAAPLPAASFHQNLPDLSVLQLSNQSLLITPLKSKSPFPSLSRRRSTLSKSSSPSPLSKFSSTTSSSTTTANATTATTTTIPASPPSSQPLFIPSSPQRLPESPANVSHLPQESPALTVVAAVPTSTKKAAASLPRSPLSSPASPQPTPHQSLLKLVASELPSGSFCELTGSPLPVFSPSAPGRDSPQLFSRFNLEDGPPGFAILYERFRTHSQAASLSDLRQLLPILS